MEALYREYPPGFPLTSFQSLLLMFHLLVLVYMLRSSYLGSMRMLSILSGERREPRENACGKATSSLDRFPGLPKRSGNEVGSKGLLTALRLGLHVQLNGNIIVGPKGRESEYRFDRSLLLVLMLTLH